MTAITPSAGLPAALHSPGPDPALADQLQLFGQFVGSWHLDWSGTDDGGGAAHMQGELHVGWVLGGRAIQDVWIVPGRGRPGEGRAPLAFHGSTIRFYDVSIGAWRSTWIEPVNGRVRRFIAEPVDDGILLQSNEENPQLRWRFSDITPHSFRWTAERSDDRGLTWRFEEEMHATRTTPAVERSTADSR
jgi:hypothetical protein